MAKSSRKHQLRRPVRPKPELKKILRNDWNPPDVTPIEADFYWVCTETAEGMQMLNYVFWNGCVFKLESTMTGRITHWREVTYPKFPKVVLN